MIRYWLIFLGLVIFQHDLLTAQILYPGENPGKARISIQPSGQVMLENKALRMEFFQDEKTIKIAGFEDITTGTSLPIQSVPLFEIMMQDGSILTSDDFMLVHSPVSIAVFGNERATSVAEKLPGKKYSADLENRETGLSLHWEADLRDGSNYVRQLFSFKAPDVFKVQKVTLLKFPAHIGAHIEGTVEGSPLVRNNMFFALEYPLSMTVHNEAYVSAYLPGFLNEVSAVWGVTPPNQLRRGFLYYVERERSHPYHQVLHYNSWYDISWDDRKFTETECLDRITAFGDSLILKRKVPMKAFLFDDGWDDNRTLWRFHSGFPDGFTKVRKTAETYNADVGVWLSPFGGYGNAKNSRIEYGNIQIPPFETNERGFSLSGPVYYSRFREVTADFIRKYDISMFKFDGLGAGSGAGPVYQKDVGAFLKLMKDLLDLKPELYISVTTGTWPSVYWLKYGDNIWRGGDDTNMAGEGSKRQQWITYRDGDTYRNVVMRGPLFPLNSLMLCGICIADNGNPGLFEMNDRDISDEIWSFFATGTNLQELYINPHRLNTANWDCLANAASWAKENEPVMADVHWVGGDPLKGEVYGFAAWSEEKAILSLRNPSVSEKTFDVHIAQIFEIPEKTNDNYIFHDVRKMKETGKQQVYAQGKAFRVVLQPFEALVLDGFPVH